MVTFSQIIPGYYCIIAFAFVSDLRWSSPALWGGGSSITILRLELSSFLVRLWLGRLQALWFRKMSKLLSIHFVFQNRPWDQSGIIFRLRVRGKDVGKHLNPLLSSADFPLDGLHWMVITRRNYHLFDFSTSALTHTLIFDTRSDRKKLFTFYFLSSFKRISRALRRGTPLYIHHVVGGGC